MAMKIPNVDVARLVRYLYRGQLAVIHGVGAPTNGVTGNTSAKPSTLYINTTNDKAYIQTGPKASVVWKLIN